MPFAFPPHGAVVGIMASCLAARARLLGSIVAAALFGVALTGISNWRLLTGFPPDRATIVPGDFWEVHFPMHATTVAAWQRGGPPLWAPGVNGGHPALADSQFGAFYPPNALAARLLGTRPYTPDVLVRQSLVHEAAGFLGAFLLFLHLASRPARAGDPCASCACASKTSGRAPALFGALVGACVFSFGGYATSYPLQVTVILETATWLPWMLLGVDLAVTTGRPIWSALAALPIALAALAGHPQTLMEALDAVALLWLWRTAAAWRSDGAGVAIRRGLAGILPVALGLALAGAQLAPTLELVPLSVRAAPGFHFASSGFAPSELTGIVLRQGFGGAAPLYLGVVALALAAAALLGGRRGAGLRSLWVTIGIGALVLSLGSRSFLYDLAYVLVPGFPTFRQQERFALLVALAAAALAAQGATALAASWASDEHRRALRPALPHLASATIAVVLAGLALAGLPSQGQGVVWGQAEHDGWAWLAVTLVLVALLVALWYGRAVPSAAWMALVAGILLLDLLSAHPDYNLRDLPSGDPYAVPALLGPVLGDHAGPFRVSTEGLLPADGNEGLLTGLEDVVGSTPLQVQLFADLQAAEQRKELDELQRLALLDVRYVLTKRELPQADGRFALLGTDGDLHLYRLSSDATLPRAWLVHGATQAAPGDELAALGKLDVRQTALVDRPVGLLQAGAATPGEGVAYVAYEPTRSVVRVMATRPGLVVFSEIWYPGWQATLDGQAAPIIRADHSFRAVAIPAGQHEIAMWYAPESLRQGITISAVAAACCLALVAIDVALAGLRMRHGIALREVGP